MENTEGKKQKPFDAARLISIPRPTAKGIINYLLKFPTDAQLIERQNARKITWKNLGRGKSQNNPVDSADIDLSIIEENLIVEDGQPKPELNEHIAVLFMETLTQADIEGMTLEGGSFTVLLSVPGAQTVHSVEMPSEKDRLNFRRNYRTVMDLPYNCQQATINLEYAGEIYNKFGKSDDYEGGVIPVIHRAIIIRGVMDELETRYGEIDRKN